MKAEAFRGVAVAAAAFSLALAGATPVTAKGKTHRAPKPAAEKHNCGGKNGCPAAASETSAKSAAPAEKPSEAK